jgi:hypothetical protein
MFRGSRHRIVVLLTGPFAAAFSCQRKGKWEVRVFFLEGSPRQMFQVVWIKLKEVSRADLKLLEENVTAKRAELLEEWEKKVLPQ